MKDSDRTGEGGLAREANYSTVPRFEGLGYNRVTEWSRGENAAAANWRANDSTRLGSAWGGGRGGSSVKGWRL